MVDDSPEDTPPSPDPGRAKRAPPTIDLEATEVSGETRNAGADAQPEPVSRETSAAISPWVIAAGFRPGRGLAGDCRGVDAGMAGAGGCPARQMPQPSMISPRVSPASSPGSASPPAPVPDPAVAARVDALEKSVGALRGELAGLRAQSEKLAAAVNDVKSAPRESAGSPDLSAINERIAGIERAARAQSSEIAQENAKPADDVPLRRIVAAALLDVLVRVGDPYAAALAAAKSLAPNPDVLKPLDGFAASGVPHVPALSRELLALVPKLSPPGPENSTTGSSLVDRLQAGAAKLVRIERTDAVGNERGNVVARVTAAALRNDYNEARRELKTLAPADRAAAQGWIEKADARDAALAVSRQFAAEAMTALAKPAP